MNVGSVSCYLMGGLGNQLFQIFTTLAYAIETGRRAVFPYSDILTIGKHRPTYWHNFLSSLRMMTTQNVKLGVNNDDFRYYIHHNESGFCHRTIPAMPNNNIVLRGYFQSHLYFDEYKDILFRMIRLREQQRDIMNKYPEYIATAGIVSMHFRLGDYKAIQDRHPVMPLAYYSKALADLASSNDILNVLYCCEEEDTLVVDEMIQELSINYPAVTFQKILPQLSDWEQMLLMSCCHYNIIANSTFSWWAAYFNMHSENIVYYPSTWFGPSLSHDISTLFPTSWKKIEI